MININENKSILTKQEATSVCDSADCLTEIYQAIINQTLLIELLEIVKNELVFYIVLQATLKEPCTIEGFTAEYGVGYNDFSFEVYYQYEKLQEAKADIIKIIKSNLI